MDSLVPLAISLFPYFILYCSFSMLHAGLGTLFLCNSYCVPINNEILAEKMIVHG